MEWDRVYRIGVFVVLAAVVWMGADSCESSYQSSYESKPSTPTPVPRLAKYLGPVQGDCDVKITEEMYADPAFSGSDAGVLLYQDGCTEAQAQAILDDFLKAGVSVVATEVMEDIEANPTEWAVLSRAGEMMDDVRDVLEPFLADDDFSEREQDLVCELLPDWREALGEGRRVALERGNMVTAERYEDGEAVVVKALAKCP